MSLSSTRVSLNILMAKVEPSDVTAVPDSSAPEAKNAAIESVVPATTSQECGSPHRSAAAWETRPNEAPGSTTRGKRPSAPPTNSVELAALLLLRAFDAGVSFVTNSFEIADTDLVP